MYLLIGLVFSLNLLVSPVAWGTAAPVAYWPMNDGTGTTATNIEGTGHGTLCQGVTCPASPAANGPTWVSGQLGGALQCDGVDDRVEVPHQTALDITGDLTMSFWVRLISTTHLSLGAPILSKEDSLDTGFTPYMVYLTTAATPRLNWYHYASGAGANVSFTGYQVPIGTWVHIALVRTISNTTVRLYVNGVFNSAQTYGANPAAASGTPLQWCATGSGDVAPSPNIGLDDLKIIPAALSDNEIAALAETSAYLTFAWDAPTTGDPPTGYKLYWRIAPAPYTSFVDVGNVLTGTMTGLTASTLYYMSVVAYNAAGDGPFSQEVGNVTGPTTPTAPTFLRLGAMACREVRLRWNPSFDNLAVTEYRLRRNGAQIGTTAGPVRSYDDAGVSPSTAYTYVVRAADALANESSDSNSLVLTTPACP